MDADQRVFRDSYGNERTGIADWAEFNVDSKQPLLGGAVCPAVEYNFSVTGNDGNVRKPTSGERRELADAVLATGRCCQGEIEDCEFRKSDPFARACRVQ